jgi:predicted metal-dependent phosphoesterase TrpH
MDCTTPLAAIIERCLDKGINCIAIADHGTIDGALKMQELAPFPVIVAEEILTPYGEIMGMFLTEGIESNISIEQAISEIKAQDALVCLPHPFDPFRGLRLNRDEIEQLARQVDVLEVFNARSPFPWTATKAEDLAHRLDIPRTAGSDAHSIGEIGSTYVEMPEFNSKDEFVQSLRKGRIHRHRSSFLVHFHSTWAKIKRIF